MKTLTLQLIISLLSIQVSFATCYYLSDSTLVSGQTDLSGLTYNAQKNALFTVRNSNEAIMKLDLTGQVLETYFFDNTGPGNFWDDTEGIVTIEQNINGTYFEFATVEERKGRIVFFNLPSPNGTINYPSTWIEITDPTNGNWAFNQGLEGITFDGSNTIYVCSEGQSNTLNRNLFGIDISSITWGATYGPANYSITDLSAFGGDLSGLHYNGTNTMLVLSHTDNKFYEIDLTTGNQNYEVDLLADVGFTATQAEGITSLADGTIFIVGEINEFFEINSVDCDDNDICTADSCDQNGNCVYTPEQDSDNDGVCDALDVCNNGPEPGSPCNDFNPITINDAINNNCVCIGEYPSYCFQVNTSLDDVEEQTDGSLNTSSSDIELIYDNINGAQIIGLRFNNITIPSGAFIENATLQFTTDEFSTGVSLLGIYGEAVANAAPFDPNQNFNVSSRQSTGAAVAWSPPEWLVLGDSGPAQQSPDITSILQEIVNQPGFVSGNSVVIMLDGVGRRVSESFDGGGQNQSAELCVSLGPSCTLSGSCNDGDDCTINDTYDANCNCVGTFQDSDNDGICDADDDCQPSYFPASPTGLTNNIDVPNGTVTLSWDSYPYAKVCLLRAWKVSQPNVISVFPVGNFNTTVPPTQKSFQLSAVPPNEPFQWDLICGCDDMPVIASPFSVPKNFIYIP